MDYVGMDMPNEWKPWFVPKEWTPTSKKVECKFCKLEVLYKKDPMVLHLGYQKMARCKGWHCVNVKGWLSKHYFPGAVVCGQ